MDTALADEPEVSETAREARREAEEDAARDEPEAPVQHQEYGP
jgi:hypothetical protein